MSENKKRKIDLSDSYQMRPSRKRVVEEPKEKPKKNPASKKASSENYYAPSYNDTDSFQDFNNMTADSMSTPKKKKRTWVIKLLLGVVIVALVSGGGFIGYKKFKHNQEKMAKLEALYNQALQSLEEKQFDEAEQQFSEIIDYKDAAQKLVEVEEARNQKIYDEAVALEEKKDFDGAREKFKALTESAFKDAKERLEKNDLLKKKDFVERLGKYLFDLNKNKELCFGVSSYVTEAWGRVRKASVIPKALEEQSVNLEQIKEKNKELQKEYKKLQGEKIFSDNQGNYKMLNDLTKTATEYYLKIYNQVKEPTGRLNEYQKKMKEYSVEFDVLYERMQDEESMLRKVFSALTEEDRLRQIEEQKSIVTGKSEADLKKEASKEAKKEENAIEEKTGAVLKKKNVENSNP